MDRVFIYWDDSRIFHEAQRLGKEREGGIRWGGEIAQINHDALLRLAHADRPIERATWAGPASAKMRKLWSGLDANGVKISASEREASGANRPGKPIFYLHERMLADGIDYLDNPGVMVLITGDGAGYMDGSAFHGALERLHRRGWRFEILSWANFCDQRMRQWAEENGAFVALEDFYESITCVEPDCPDDRVTAVREATPLDLSRRPRCGTPGLATPTTDVQRAVSAQPATGAQPAATALPHQAEGQGAAGSAASG